MAELIDNILLRTNRMKKAAEAEFACATDVADYLAKKGVPFRTAHAVTGKIVRWCIENERTLTWTYARPCAQRTAQRRAPLTAGPRPNR